MGAHGLLREAGVRRSTPVDRDLSPLLPTLTMNMVLILFPA
ncbi:hypothetical protein BN2537_14787 [Streptomyces venezuelae]|nr:hypothetical protein BN2537_14787 [Streptomyces venezuelae]